jgi:hypothetical protein
MRSCERSTELVRAHVVLKGQGGSLSTTSQISAQNVQSLIADPSTRERVRVFLQNAGFEICRVSHMSITVEAPAAKFERVFRGRLKKGSSKRQGSGTKRKNIKRSEAPESGAWTWAHAPEIPPEVREAIDAVVFPQPTKSLA